MFSNLIHWALDKTTTYPGSFSYREKAVLANCFGKDHTVFIINSNIVTAIKIHFEYALELFVMLGRSLCVRGNFTSRMYFISLSTELGTKICAVCLKVPLRWFSVSKFLPGLGDQKTPVKNAEAAAAVWPGFHPLLQFRSLLLALTLLCRVQ